MKSQTKSELYRQALNRAQSLLAMREHGGKELKRKLLQKLPDLGQQPGLVDEVLAECQAHNWQSNARYVESYTRMAREKGQGALKIRQALMQACDDKQLIDQALADNHQAWLEVAQQALLKKYGETKRPDDRKEYAKRLRFLQTRGFSAEQCYKAFSAN